MIECNARLAMIVSLFLVVGAAGACGGGEGSDDTGTASDTSTATDTQATADAGGRDAGTEDAGAGDGGECDPKEVARETVGTIEETAPGSVDVEESDGVYSGTIEATAGGLQNAPDTSFLYLDLDAAARANLSDAEAFESDAWTIAFKRTEIRLNGADSGPGGWHMMEADKSWEELTEAPGREAEWKQDDFVAGDCSLNKFGRGSLKTAFAQWYDYNPMTHAVSAPENAVYVLYQMASHRVVKFEIESYSDATYEVRWTEL